MRDKNWTEIEARQGTNDFLQDVLFKVIAYELGYTSFIIQVVAYKLE